MGVCPSRNKPKAPADAGRNSQQAIHEQGEKPPEKLLFTDGSSYNGSMTFSEHHNCWIQHGNGTYTRPDGTIIIANFVNGGLNLTNSVQVNYAGSGRTYSGRMSIVEGQPVPNGQGQLRDTKQDRLEVHKGEFKEGVLYNGQLTLNKQGVCVSITVTDGNLVRENPKNSVKEQSLPNASKDVTKKQSWADALDEKWEEQRGSRGYSDGDVMEVNANAEALMREEDEEKKAKGQPSSTCKKPKRVAEKSGRKK
jgi:hypothetical protein